MSKAYAYFSPYSESSYCMTIDGRQIKYSMIIYANSFEEAESIRIGDNFFYDHIFRGIIDFNSISSIGSIGSIGSIKQDTT